MTAKDWYPLLATLLLLLVWHGWAIWLDSPALPSPTRVFDAFLIELSNGRLLYHLGVTLGRLIASFTLAMALGTGLGILLGRHPRLDEFFDTWLILALNVPALVTVILCYVWLGLGEVAAITAVVLNKVPNVVVTIREGTRALDAGLLAMARIYRFDRAKTLRHVIWPQLFPFIMVASRNGLALIWKIILVVELLGCSNGMGYQLNLFFQMFDVPGILAYTGAFIMVVQLVESLVFKPLDTRSRRWRR